MTTVAWDGTWLAADSQEQDHCIEPYSSQKLFRVKNTLVGLAGDRAESLRFLKWIERGEIEDEGPKALHGFYALVIRPSGRAFEYTKSLMPLACAKRTAIGSGRGPALGALLAGATAVEAVRIARRLDPYTGGRIRKLKLK